MGKNEMSRKTDLVAIPRETARTALQEVGIAIKQTGGAGTDNACSPLALARQKIESDEGLDEDAKEHVIDILHEVSDERGVEISDADPLVDGTFRAQTQLEKALEADEDTYVVADGKSPDEGDVFREELHDVAHGMVTTAFIFDTDDRGLTGFKVSTDSIEWVDFSRQEA